MSKKLFLRWQVAFFLLCLTAFKGLAAVLNAPTGVTATPNSPVRITLSWTDTNASPNNEISYQIEIGSAAAGPFNVLTSTAVNATSYIVNGLSGNTTYYFRIIAIAGSGDTNSPGAVTNATTGACTLTGVSISGSNSFCPIITPLGVPLTATATGGTGTIIYEWRRDGSSVQSSTATNYTAPIPSDYQVFATDATGCVVASTVHRVTSSQPANAGLLGSYTAKQGTNPTFTATCEANSEPQWFLDATNQRNYIGNTATITSPVTFDFNHRVFVRCFNNAAACQSEFRELSIRFVTIPPDAIPDVKPVNGSCGPAEFSFATSGCPLGQPVNWYDKNGQFVGSGNPFKISLRETTRLWIECTNEGLVSRGRGSVEGVVLPLPNVDLRLSGSTNICDGDSVTITSLSNLPNTFYSLVRNDAPVTRSRNNTFVIKESGVYKVVNEVIPQCPNFSPPITITKFANPPKPVTAASGKLSFCADTSVTLSTTSAGTDYVYMWFKDGKDFKMGKDQKSIKVSEIGNFTLQIKATNDCVSPISSAYKVNVNPLPPTPSITLDGPSTFCFNKPSTLNTTARATSYVWHKGNVTTPLQEGKDTFFKPTETGIYALEVGDDSLCYSPFSNTIEVKVDPIPTKPVISTAGSATFCSDKTLTLTSTEEKEYLWSEGSKTRAVTVNKTGDYTVTVTNNFGCSTVSDAFKITVNPQPQTPVISAGGPLAFCNGGKVTLTSTAENKYTWSTGATTRSIDVDKSTILTVKVTSPLGCESLSSNPTEVIVKELPAKPSIQQLSLLELKALNSPVGDGYEWKLGTATLASSTDIVKVNRAGQVTVRRFIIYAVPGNNNLQCFSEIGTFDFKVDASLNNPDGVVLYPNPTNTGNMFLETIEVLNNVEVKIYSLLGQEVFSTVLSKVDGKLTLDLSGLGNGNYVAYFTTNDNRKILRKIFISK
jgi:hypothetical protein